MKIAFATDHAGFEAVQQLKTFVASLGHEVVDFGPQSLDIDDDYPDFIFPAASAVADGSCGAGIIFGLSGQGEAMAANRVKGVRCTLFYTPAVPQNTVGADGQLASDPYEILRLSRQHNHANMLSLSGSFLSLDEMKQAIQVWLTTPYSDAERHGRRVQKLDELA